MIGTGGYYCGPELRGSAVDKMLRGVGQAVNDVAGDWKEGDAPSVIVLFVVPGSLGEVNFSGLRQTLFSKKKKLVQIEAAVPREVAESGGPIEFVITALHKANAIAAETFAQKGMQFDLAKAEAIVEKVRQTLLAQGELAE